MTGDGVAHACEHDSTWPGGVDEQLVARAEPGASKRVGGNSRLMLSTDSGATANSFFLYFTHHK